MAERKRFQAHQPVIVSAAPKSGIHVLWWNWRILGQTLSFYTPEPRKKGKGRETYNSLTLINTTQTENAKFPIAKRLWSSVTGTTPKRK
jgi:hypothetical protein